MSIILLSLSFIHNNYTNGLILIKFLDIVQRILFDLALMNSGKIYCLVLLLTKLVLHLLYAEFQLSKCKCRIRTIRFVYNLSPNKF